LIIPRLRFGRAIRRPLVRLLIPAFFTGTALSRCIGTAAASAAALTLAGLAARLLLTIGLLFPAFTALLPLAAFATIRTLGALFSAFTTAGFAATGRIPSAVPAAGGMLP